MISIRDIAMVSVGACAALLISKNKKSILNKMDDIKDNAIEMASDKLDNMR